MFFLISSILFFDRSVNCSRNKRKDDFLQASFDYENSLKKTRYFSKANLISIEDSIWYNSKNSKIKPRIVYSNDSIFEMFRLMNYNYQVSANTAADSVRMGGCFTTLKEFREGEGDQEESIMSLFNGYLISLEPHAKQHANGKIERRAEHNGSYVYKNGILDKNILCSTSLYLRVSMVLFYHYCYNPENFEKFSDFLEDKFSLNVFEFTENHKYKINLYTIAGSNKRNYKTNLIDYTRIKHITELQISTMLKHAIQQGSNAIVITIPGSGIRENNISPYGLINLEKYLDSVEQGTLDAIKKFGRGYKEIVICGHRSSPWVEIE